MVGRRGLRPTRIVDTRTGSGRFLAAAADRFPQANLVAVESDPVAALMLRATAATRGFEERLSVKVADYRRIRLPGIEGRTLFIGNPPYVRHHDITARSRLPGSGGTLALAQAVCRRPPQCTVRWQEASHRSRRKQERSHRSSNTTIRANA